MTTVKEAAAQQGEDREPSVNDLPPHAFKQATGVSVFADECSECGGYSHDPIHGAAPVAGAEQGQPIETIEWWAGALQRQGGQALVASMLADYALLRRQLRSQPASGASEQEMRAEFCKQTGRVATSHPLEYQAFVWGHQFALRADGERKPASGAGVESRVLSGCAVRAAIQQEPNAEIARLREIEHRVWHLLDDSEQRDDEIVCMRGEDYAELCKLLPEDHPRASGPT